MARFTSARRATLARFIAPKGSVALDGVSLTVNEVDDDISRADHPAHAAGHDAPGWQAGDRGQLEVDLMARYAARLMRDEVDSPASALALAPRGTKTPAIGARQLPTTWRQMAEPRRASAERPDRPPGARVLDRRGALLRRYRRTRCWRARSSALDGPARRTSVVTVPGALEIPAALAIALEAAERAEQAL